MIRLISKQTDGQRIIRTGRPFKGSHILTFRYDNASWTYAYDDVEEMVNEYSRYVNQDEYFTIYQLNENKTKILDIENISSEFDNQLLEYRNWYIQFNGLITVNKFLELTD